MRIKKIHDFEMLGFNEAEKFFCQTWYSMTNIFSLDSYRMKCMNSRTILRELTEELNIGFIKNKDVKDFKSLNDEAYEIIEKDNIIKLHMSNSYSLILSHLAEPPDYQDKKKDENFNKIMKYELDLNDAYNEINRRYFYLLCNELPNYIELGDFQNIEILTNYFLSDLIDQGWNIISLFNSHHHFFKKNHKHFNTKLNSLLEIYQKENNDHIVSLKIHNGHKLNEIQEFYGFEIRKPHDTDFTNSSEVKFFTPKQSEVIIEYKTKAPDFIYAAEKAREEFEQVVDLLRFFYEKSTIKISESCHIRRLTDNKTYMHIFKDFIPNPLERRNKEDIINFINDINKIIESEFIEEKTKNQIQATLRLYRFGSDTQNYNDKFLHWWMGLEHLCNNGSGSIGEVVSKNVSNIISITYIQRLLKDYLSTLKYIDIDISDIISDKNIYSLDICDLIMIFQNEKMFNNFIIELSKYDNCHILKYKGEKLFDILSNREETKNSIISHHNHVYWQLLRIYRIRCCIVHGSNVRIRLNLISSNLEYYLKQSLWLIVENLKKHDHIKNIEGVLNRCSIKYKETIDKLSEENVGHSDIEKIALLDVVRND